MWTIFKVFNEFVTLSLFFFNVLVFWLQGMRDLSSPTRDRTLTPCIGRRSLNHWTTREAPVRAKVLNFDEVQFITFFFYELCFWCQVKQFLDIGLPLLYPLSFKKLS